MTAVGFNSVRMSTPWICRFESLDAALAAGILVSVRLFDVVATAEECSDRPGSARVMISDAFGHRAGGPVGRNNEDALDEIDDSLEESHEDSLDDSQDESPDESLVRSLRHCLLIILLSKNVVAY